MKNITLILSTVLFFSCNLRSYCQKGTIDIRGNIDTAITKMFANQQLSVIMKRTNNKSGAATEISKIRIDKNGNFHINLKPAHAVYLAFEMVNLGPRYSTGRSYSISFPKRQLVSELVESYFFELGDSVTVSIQKEGVLVFSGWGAEKLNCQNLMYSIDNVPLSSGMRALDFMNKGQFETSIYFQDKLSELALKMQIAVLDSYKSKLSDKVYKTLYLDALALSEYPLLNFLWIMSYKSEAGKMAAQKYAQFSLNRPFPIPIDTTYFAESGYYADLIFIKEFNRLRLYSSSKSFISGDSFIEIYENLKRKYTGKLRDKLLLICFERLNSYYSDEAKSLVDDAIQTMQCEEYKQLLKDWKRNRYAAFAFELQDSSGKTHYLKDYLGKLLVIDFWYTGCSYCAELNKAMHPIIEKYKHNREIRFLTVSVDLSKEKWINSLASKKYTSAESINLFTNGMGTNHPLIKNYNFKGYPQQLIIGKNGEFVTSSPPRVDDHTTGEKSNARLFMAILDRNLKTESKK
jgi:thiol-disulfide isomerase/thioredoxin